MSSDLSKFLSEGAILYAGAALMLAVVGLTGGDNARNE